MRASFVVLISLALGACHAEAPVTFSLGTPPGTVEVATRHRLSAHLTIGVGEDVDEQPLDSEASQRARVEWRERASVVRWLEHPSLAGRSFSVEGGEARALDDGAPLSGDEAGDTTAAAAVALGPDALQVALLRRPLRLRESAPHLDTAFAALARRALGPSVSVEHASLRLQAATDAVAVFSATLVTVTRAGAVTLRAPLYGSLEVRRADTLPLALTLEGPVEVSSQTMEDAPGVSGLGTLVLSRRVTVLAGAADEAPVRSAMLQR
ncbi:MAG: hypothetical protein IAE78_17195 [Myxococcus sp.]|nr:hypothetical protein [Myxococcus sp.]